MSRRGRAAPMPDPGYEPPPRLIMSDTTCVVHFHPEEGGRATPFDFGRLPVHRDLQIELARGFERITGPSGGRRALKSAKGSYQALAHFARFIATLPDPPRRAAHITSAGLDHYLFEWRDAVSMRGMSMKNEGSALRGALLAVDTLSLEIRAYLERLDLPRQQARSAVESYSLAEERRIIAAARIDLRAAAERIRAGVDLLTHWRAGEIDRTQDKATWERGYLFDYVATYGDVPRYATGQRLCVAMLARHGRSAALVNALHLTAREAAAACVLLISGTGVNGEAIATTTVAHERADSGADELPITIITVVKPRRGRRARYMSIPLAHLPAWVGSHQPGEVTLGELDEVTTPFGIYTLLLELTATARALCGSPRLFLWASDLRGGRHNGPITTIVREGLPQSAVPDWSWGTGLQADPVDVMGDAAPLVVTMARLRLTYLQRKQRPVAHSMRTLSDEYLIRDQGGVVEYQRVVAQTLQEQETNARQNIRAQVLSNGDIEQATRDQASTARQFGISVEVLKCVLDGCLNTVLAACIDNTNSPFSPAGLPCVASFLMCLSCSCARITPQHLPTLLVAREGLEQRRDTMTPLAWARLFARPHAQLGDLIGRFMRATVEAARSEITDNDRQLVQRLLARELDLN